MTRRKVTPAQTVIPPKTPVYSIEDLAQQIVDDAMGPTIDLDLRVDAFKALTTYHLGKTKLEGKNPSDDDTVQSFGRIKDRIRQAG